MSSYARALSTVLAILGPAFLAMQKVCVPASHVLHFQVLYFQRPLTPATTDRVEVLRNAGRPKSSVAVAAFKTPKQSQSIIWRIRHHSNLHRSNTISFSELRSVGDFWVLLLIGGRHRFH